MLNFLRSIPPVFHSGSTNLHPHQKYTSVPFSLHPCQHLISLAFLIISILIGVRSYLIVVLICISLMISDVEHLFRYVLAISMSSLGNCLLTVFAHFEIRLFLTFLPLSCMSSLHILDINISYYISQI